MIKSLLGKIVDFSLTHVHIEVKKLANLLENWGVYQETDLYKLILPLIGG